MLAPVRDIEPERHDWAIRQITGNHPYLQRLAFLGNPRAGEEMFSSGNAASDATGEVDSTGNLVGTYGSMLESVGRPGSTEEHASKYALKVTPSGASKSGVQFKVGQPLKIVYGHEYLIVWRVYSEGPLDDLRFGVRSSKSLAWAIHPFTRSNRQSVRPGVWTSLAAIYTADETTDDANIFVHSNQKTDTVWFLDDVRIGEAGGYELARVCGNPSEYAVPGLRGLPPNHPAGIGHEETTELAPLAPIYDSRLQAVGVGAEIESIVVGKLALQIRPNGESRSGVSQDKSRFKLEPGASYEYSAFVCSPTVAREILLGVRIDDGEIVTVRDSLRGKSTWSVSAGTWVKLGGVLEVPINKGGNARFWVVGWDSIADPWYIDGIELTPIGR